MSRRPIERVPIADQCARCFRRRLAGELLCRTHLDLKYAQQDVAERQLYQLTHQDVAGSLPASPESGSRSTGRQQPTAPPRNREEQRQAQEAASFGSSVLVPVLDKTCPHRGADWCEWCASWQTGAEAADFDGGGSAMDGGL